MSERGRPEEKIYAGHCGSLGVIDIVDGPIRWVNVTFATFVWGEDNDPPIYLVYGVPDPKVRSGFPEVRLQAIPVQEKDLGEDERVIGVRWKGEDFDLGVVQHLSQNVLVTRAFLEYLSKGFSLEIRAYPGWRCWTLTVEDVLSPSKQEWDSYQSIASHLLGTPMPSNT